MSLKAFHIIFITAASALAAACAVWGFHNYFSAGRDLLDLFFGIGSVLAGVGLLGYERYFLKKSKNISYL